MQNSGLRNEFHIGRVLLASLFVLSGINKVINYSVTADAMLMVGLSPIWLTLPVTISLEPGGDLLLATSKRFSAPAARCLALFTLTTNLFFHRFWELNGDLATTELSLFFQNVAIAGGLLFVAAKLQQRKSVAGQQ